jgi:hypothetical protein
MFYEQNKDKIDFIDDDFVVIGDLSKDNFTMKLMKNYIFFKDNGIEYYIILNLIDWFRYVHLLNSVASQEKKKIISSNKI